MSSTFEQQPLQRTVGRRQPRDGQAMTAADRAAMSRNARYQTRAPKGVFRYDSADAMDADRLRWTVDLIAERHGSRRWIAALSKLPDHAAAELAAEPDVFSRDKRYAIRVNDEFTVDVMPSIAGLSWAEMKPHVTNIDIDGVAVRVLDLPGLLKTKQGVRPKDQMDAAVLRAAIERLSR